MSSKNFSGIQDNHQSTNDGAVLEREEPRKAKHIAKYGLVKIRKEESVYKAIGILVEKNISGLPVVDDTGLVGVISEKDVLGLLFDNEYLPGTVEDYMVKNITCFDEEDSLIDVCDCLINNHFRRIIVLQRGKLAGIISRSDLIKANKDKFKPQDLPEEAAKQCSILAKDVMKCGLLTIRPQTPIYEAMEILATKNITGLPVVDDHMNLVGIVSEKDMLKLLYDPKIKPGKAKDFMTEEVVSFNQDDSLLDICDCLINNHFRRVPILNQGKVVGIISRADIIVYILKNKSDFFRQR